MFKALLAIAGVAAIGVAKKGSSNQDSDFSLVRVETKRAGWSGNQMMRSFQRTGIPPHHPGSHNPNRLIGLSITIEGKDPMTLQRYHQGGTFAQRIARKNGLFNPFMTLRNVHRSNRKADCWEAIWDAR